MNEVDPNSLLCAAMSPNAIGATAQLREIRSQTDDDPNCGGSAPHTLVGAEPAVFGRYSSLTLCPEAAMLLRDAMADRENQSRVSWPTLNEWLTQLERIMQKHQRGFRSFAEQPNYMGMGDL